MRSLLLLCALAAALIVVCKPSKRYEEPTYTPVAVASAPQRELPSVRQPSLLSLLTLGAAVLATVSASAAESPLDDNAQLAVRILDATAELVEASGSSARERRETTAARVAAHAALTAGADRELPAVR